MLPGILYVNTDTNVEISAARRQFLKGVGQGGSGRGAGGNE